MNNKAYLVPESSAGWVIGWATVSESGEPEMEAFLAHFERDYPDEQWLMMFRTQDEAKAYIVAKFPFPGPEGCQWACTEFSASELLEFLRDYPNLEGVLFNPGSEEAHFVPAAVLIGVLERTLDEPEGDAA